MKKITYPSDPISPVLTQSATLQNELSLGLTKREYIAIEICKALVTAQIIDEEGNAKIALLQTDFLIKELNK